MARNFSTRTDTDKTELAKYPDGRIKDGITDGTKAGEEVVGDFQQVFLKAMRDAGITPNGLPDNATNGWQMFDACFGTTKVPITKFYNGVQGGSSTPNIFKKPVRTWKENGGKTLRIEGWFSGGTTGIDDLLFEMPDGYNSSDVFGNIMAMTDSPDHTDGSISFSAGIITTNKKISGTLGDVNHYINASIPLD